AHPLAPSFDVSVPAGALDAYVARIEAGLKTLDASYAPYVYGHLADGNLHISINCDGQVPHERHEAIEDVLYEGLNEAGGSFSAEHGIGDQGDDRSGQCDESGEGCFGGVTAVP
ncbi:MAG: hypothetical protein E5W56_18350, partial [Mesorhizobium sp.]